MIGRRRGKAIGRRVRRLGRCLAVALVAMGPGCALAGQSPLDIFGSHFGGSRRPAVAKQWWASISALLLTEFDGRLVSETPLPRNPNPDFVRFDGLQTSVGYNYLTVGGNLVLSYNAESFIPVLPRNTALTLAVSGHLGFTLDSLFLAPGQTALHDFRGVTRNFRPNLEDNYLMIGADVEALLWPETKWLAFGAHLSVGTYHQEQGLTLILADRFGSAKSYLQLTGGWVTTSGVGPAPVAAALDDSYFSVRAGLEHTDRYGLGVVYSTGIFPGESEFFISLHTAVQLGSTTWLRIEHVNDLLGGKDRGPTGGARVTLAKTF